MNHIVKIILFLFPFAIQALPVAHGVHCDRTCLLNILTIYTDAISLKNISAVPTSPAVRVTNNGNLSTLGQGLVWHTPGDLRIPYRHALVDEISGSATLRATISNVTVPINATVDQIVNPPPGKWWWYALRLRVVDGLITEIEEIVSATGIPGGLASSLTQPDRIWDTYIPHPKQLSRAELFNTANQYFSTVAGQLPWEQAPFHPECNRIELGTQTTNAVFAPGSCGTEFLSPGLQGGTVTNRRFYVADPEVGVVAAIGWFGGPQSTAGVAVFEVFKIQDGLIRHIEAFFPLEGMTVAGW